ncbi:MAG: hypothetical protein CMG21_01785 [Candidatus Marinimicrobia bacterium]|nr:hypothetical protein [Candidatus Neomarinimicrobiota bacterium]|tara:strand:- start:460 stop:1383 length:924 start_codon:yes stop_codon:yes gene_type:complete
MRVLILLLLPLLITSCSTVSYIKDYDNTNPIKIEEATGGLKINEMIPSNLDGTIAVRSIELDLEDHLDMGVIYMIEDHLITNLIENKYKVLERDPQALSNLYRESSSNYMKNNSKNSDSQDSSSQDPESSEAVNVIVNVSDQKLNSDNNESDKLDESDKLVTTDLNAADYMLSYRVLECGVIYTALESEKRTSATDLNKLKRSARTRLHCRLTNTKTSEIVSSGIVENEITDIISKDDIMDLEQISYQYYHHTLPLQNTQGLTEDSGYAFVNESRPIQSAANTAKKGSFLKTAGFMLGMLFLLTIDN